MELADDATIVDRRFAVPVPVRALVAEVLNENVVAEALVARLEQRGELRGRREALGVLLGARGVALSAEHAARIEACNDAATLDAWVARAATAQNANDVFGG